MKSEQPPKRTRAKRATSEAPGETSVPVASTTPTPPKEAPALPPEGTPRKFAGNQTATADQVLDEESLEINRQRDLRFNGNGDAGGDVRKAPLVGVSLSGGGIRSATFCLGALQTLCRLHLPVKKAKSKRPLMDFMDYLSTVSGGGYIGSWFTANRQRVKNGYSFVTKSAPTDTHASCEEATEAVSHLRRYSHYLSPVTGLMSADTWTLFTIWLRNTLLIQSMVFCVAGVCMLLAHLWMRTVNGVPGVLKGLLSSDFICHGTGIPIRLVELLFPLGIFICFFIAYRNAREELQLYVEDKMKDLGKEVQKDVKPLNQSRVQKRIVGPAVIAALITTLWLWWHHVRLNDKRNAAVKGWWSGEEPGNMVASPWMVLLTFAVVVLAFRLLWSKTDLTDKPGQSGKLGSRVLYFLALFSGGLFTLYLVDEAFRFMSEAQTAFAGSSADIRLKMEMPNGQINASYSTQAAAKDFDIRMGLVATFGPTLMVLKYMFMLILGLGLKGRRMQDNIREWWSRVGAWLMIYSLVLFLGCGIALFGPILFDWLGHHWDGWVQKGLVASWLTALLTSVLLGKGEDHTGQEKKKSVLSLENITLFATFGLLVGVAWTVRFMLIPDGYEVGGDPLLLGTLNAITGGWFDFASVFILLLAAGAVLVWRVDLNEFSMNHFYRNRLVRCYLGGAMEKNNRRPHPFTGFEFRDDKPLSSFTAEAGHPGPYPLINAALNTSQGGDLEVQERKAEAFLLSPLFCGSARRRLSLSHQEMASVCEGYRPTPLYMSGQNGQKLDADADTQFVGMKIGTAMSISGAAASPNSGYHTAPLLAFLMTIFNVRLGWWVPNPSKKEWLRDAPAFGWRDPGYLKYLCFELFGSATPGSSFLYLSDGGHFENLGVYELVRRRCRFIIAIDGEEDGDFTFHALGTAIRRCRVDFDAEIEINVEEMRPDERTGLSRSHCAVGKIHYTDAPQGTLLYIKASVTGDESTDIAQYRKLSPAFPHESTGDQFFSESQFESYRKLGLHATEEAMAPLMRQIDPADDTDPTLPLRKELEQHWYRAAKAPPQTFVNHTQVLDDLWSELSKDGLPECLSDIVLPNCSAFANPGRPAAPMPMPTAPDELRKVFCFGQRLLQLMENVYLDMQLSTTSTHPDQTGWLALFKAWARHPVLAAVWDKSKDTYGKRFANFWDDLRR